MNIFDIIRYLIIAIMAFIAAVIGVITGIISYYILVALCLILMELIEINSIKQNRRKK